MPDRRSLSIAFLCNEYPPASHGGIGTFTQLIARSLVTSGWRVRVTGLCGPTCKAPRYEIDEGVEVFRQEYPGKDFLSLRARLLLFLQVKEWAARGEVDLVEAPDAEGWAAGWPGLPIPVVARVHGSGSYFAAELGRPATMNSRLLFLIERASMRRMDYWCSVSRYAAEKTRRLFSLQDVNAVTYNPVIPERAVGLDQRSRNIIVFTGTLTPKKGIYSLAAAWSLVNEQRPDAELHIYGKDLGSKGGLVSEALLKMVSAAARGSVVFHGHQPRETVIESLRTARAAVFPSYAEAFAFAPLEAMACGCPTIYSSRCSGPEAIDDMEDGLLVDPDDFKGIAGSIVRLLNDDSLAERLGKAGARKIRSRFAMESTSEQIRSFYSRCVDDFNLRRGASIPGRDGAPSEDR